MKLITNQKCLKVLVPHRHQQETHGHCTLRTSSLTDGSNKRWRGRFLDAFVFCKRFNEALHVMLKLTVSVRVLRLGFCCTAVRCWMVRCCCYWAEGELKQNWTKISVNYEWKKGSEVQVKVWPRAPKPPRWNDDAVKGLILTETDAERLMMRSFNIFI